MPDRTLVKAELLQKGSNLLTPFDEKMVRGASYDFRVGEVVFVSDPDSETGVTAISLGAAEGQDKYALPPGRAAVVRSLEKLAIPADMKGHLSLRNFFATKLLFFVGGPIDPGYHGFLFFPVANLSDVAITLKHGEPLITCEFVKLAAATELYEQGSERLALPSDRLPARAVRRPYDPVQMSDKLDKLIEQLRELSNTVRIQEPAVRSLEAILRYVIFGVVAGSFTGLLVASIQKVPWPWDFVTVLVGVLLAGAGVLYYQYTKTKAKSSTGGA